MRHFAITGIVTASWISRILSGSDIRATPPWTRMSAGTRSSAITATAPASSAIRAWSASTTSMITPPFNISASPVLTRIVPSSSMWISLLGRASLVPVAGDASEKLRERVPLVLVEAVEEQSADPGDVRLRADAELVEALIGQACVAHPSVVLARGALDVARALEPFEQTRDPGRREQHLLVVDRQPVLGDELLREPADDGGVCAEEPRERLEPGVDGDWGAHQRSLTRQV